MLWSKNRAYELEPFLKESELELSINELKEEIFGPSRIYLDVKKKIGAPKKTQNIPDGYLIDLTSKIDPKLYVVENEISSHHTLKHIAVQILEFSLSYESSPHKVKEIVREALQHKKPEWDFVAKYSEMNGFENVDRLLDKLILKNDFNALVIIDNSDDELETVLHKKFRFPVEILTIRRFISSSGERLYEFEPFLSDVYLSTINTSGTSQDKSAIDPAEIDTIVVPAREEGFQEAFIGDMAWDAIRIRSTMIPKVKYIAAYRVAPISAITHWAPVRQISLWKDSNKYELFFSEPATEIKPIKLVRKGAVKAPLSPRYTSLQKLLKAKTLEEAF